jgi:hypothetical protein
MPVDEPSYPIVLRMKTRNKLFVLGIGVFLLVVGVFASGDDGTTRAPFVGHMPTYVLGWMGVGIGLVVSIAGLQTLLRDLPLVKIAADGVTVVPTFGRTKAARWDEVERWRVISSRYASGVSITKSDGKAIMVPALDGTPDDLYDVLKRTALAAHKQGGV